MVDPRKGGEIPGLEEYNEQATESWREVREREDLPRPAGVACPECGREMEYVDNIRRQSIPPKRKVVCPECGEVGYKVVG